MICTLVCREIIGDNKLGEDVEDSKEKVGGGGEDKVKVEV